VKFDFIAAKEVAFPVATMCRVLGVSPSGYYACKSRLPSKRLADDARVAAAHKASRGIYGSPRVHQLQAKGSWSARSASSG
jgi:putative transposase